MSLDALDAYIPKRRKSLDDKLGSAVGWLTGEKYRERVIQNIKNHEQRVTYKQGRYPSIVDEIGTLSGKKIIVVGGGSSVADTLPRIRSRRRVSSQVKIVAANKSHDWLISKGMVPDYGVLSDPRPHVLNYMTPHKDCTYFLAACLDPIVFERFQGYDYKLWVPVNEEDDPPALIEALPSDDGWEHAFVSGGSTIGLRIPPMFSILGANDFEMHGLDSCYQPAETEDDALHLYAYDKPESDYELIDVTAVSRETEAQFRCITNKNMANQMREFPWFLDKAKAFVLNNVQDGLISEKTVEQKVTVAGDGVIPWLAWKAGCHLTPDAMQKKHGNGDVDNRGEFYKQLRTENYAA